MRPRVALLLIHDGRGYRDGAIESARRWVRFPSGEPDYFIEVDDSDHELGFAGAVARGWERVCGTGADYVFHLEEDFRFLRTVPLMRMIRCLERTPNLVQITLKRQPWSAEERAAGGIVEKDPDSYRQVVDQGDIYLAHRKFFSTNPSIYSAGLCYQGWPRERYSEGVFTHRLLDDPDAMFALWGAKRDGPWVEHVGLERAGHGY